MILQSFVNLVCGSVVCYSATQLWNVDQPILALIVVAAWVISIINTSYSPK
jgi:hypothetical protein